LFTYARICAEIDLSKGLLDKLILKQGKKYWTRILDYQNTYFHYRICDQSSHLQDACPHSRDPSKRKKDHPPKSKSSRPYEPPNEDNEDEPKEKDLSMTKVEKDTNGGLEKYNVDLQMSPKFLKEFMHEVPQIREIVSKGIPSEGIKINHEYKPLNSSQEQGLIQNANLQLALESPPLKEWT
jgi:hypothetical protein